MSSRFISEELLIPKHCDASNCTKWSSFNSSTSRFVPSSDLCSLAFSVTAAQQHPAQMEEFTVPSSPSLRCLPPHLVLQFIPLPRPCSAPSVAALCTSPTSNPHPLTLAGAARPLESSNIAWFSYCQTAPMR